LVKRGKGTTRMGHVWPEISTQGCVKREGGIQTIANLAERGENWDAEKYFFQGPPHLEKRRRGGGRLHVTATGLEGK